MPAAASRPLYRRADLLRLLEPRSIAIIGASARPASFGERTQRNLAGFGGRVHLVNARYDRLGDQPCHPNVAALPEVPDLAVVAAPMEAVEGIVTECAVSGVGAVMLYAAGFAETGKPERIALQARIAEIARAGRVRLVGPNCLGMLDYASGATISFAAVPRPAAPPTRPALGIVSQSGNLGFALAQGVERGVAIGRVLACGNSADLDVADCVAALAEDPGCSAIACVFEGMADPLRLVRAAELAWEADKPLVITKLAVGEGGAAAALSHTGSLAGSEAAYRAAFERAGVVLVDKFEALLETAAFLGKAPPPKAPGVALVSTSGGAAIMSADKAEIHGVPMPQPGPAAQAVLDARIPEYGSARNPVDITAQVLSDPDSLRACAEAICADPAYGAVVLPNGYAYDFATPRFALLGELAAQHGKAAAVVWLTEWLEGPGAREAEANPNLGLFRSMDRCFAALAAWQARAAALLDGAGSTTLTEREAKAVLAAYGVPVVGERLVRDAEAAVAAAEALGLPVVLKVESPDIPHKTEAGVIRLNLGDAAAVREGFAAVMANAAHAVPEARINGVLVQPMVPQGLEIVVGARRDPLFGPMVVVGLGGILVELLRDSATSLAPVGTAEAHAMLDRLRGAKLLDGFRGLPPVDRDALAAVIRRVSELAADQADRIEEIDVNPLICAGPRITAVDALIVRR
ncbi:acetate--CoA ligase family protein [Roseicella aerolata]|uniref:Acetate--CoA ligase family protein n=1 Tax=Roseicella aerolata TaxID=2883479 RepID=A0A9X1L5Z5_9PROT|nr:acetate--CoA ligase family protein [Roseicella aerolata]MCB4820271.1 acetate--CoA ligase family protein [Roseicella aerolata]